MQMQQYFGQVKCVDEWSWWKVGDRGGGDGGDGGGGNYNGEVRVSQCKSTV